MYQYHLGLMGKTLTSLSQSKTKHHTCVYVVPPGFEDDPMAVRTFDASSEEAGWL